ncbi:MAG TPA: Kdo hydroxylase family protein [Rhodopila sp.]|nr:Kdo hydroxylase family protein [Rhodopila sp.]
MQPDQVVTELPVTGWTGPFGPQIVQTAVSALEAGRVIVLPALAFAAEPAELSVLSADLLSGRRKNISLDRATGKIGGAAAVPAPLEALMRRFAFQADSLARGLLAPYGAALRAGRTSFRPAEIAGRSYSPRKDDRRLHIDAFPTRPLHGDRILRLFANIAPDGKARAWRVGEPFASLAARFLPSLPTPTAARARLYAMLGLTKGVRSGYDQLMLALHDTMKLDEAYQSRAPALPWSFPAGTTWMVFTDQVPHAAMAGHFALEQTFYLPVSAMASPETAPLRVLERLTGRVLA